MILGFVTVYLLLWADNVHFPVQLNKSVKINKNRPIITKKFNRIFLGKIYHELPWSWQDVAAHQRLSHIMGVISELIGVSSRNSLGTINSLIFSAGWSKLCYIFGEVKNSKSFTRELSRLDSAGVLRWCVKTVLSVSLVYLFYICFISSLIKHIVNIVQNVSNEKCKYQEITQNKLLEVSFTLRNNQKTFE